MYTTHIEPPPPPKKKSLTPILGSIFRRLRQFHVINHAQEFPWGIPKSHILTLMRLLSFVVRKCFWPGCVCACLKYTSRARVCVCVCEIHFGDASLARGHTPDHADHVITPAAIPCLVWSIVCENSGRITSDSIVEVKVATGRLKTSFRHFAIVQPNLLAGSLHEQSNSECCRFRGVVLSRHMKPNYPRTKSCFSKEEVGRPWTVGAWPTIERLSTICIAQLCKFCP